MTTRRKFIADSVPASANVASACSHEKTIVKNEGRLRSFRLKLLVVLASLAVLAIVFLAVLVFDSAKQNDKKQNNKLQSFVLDRQGGSIVFVAFDNSGRFLASVDPHGVVHIWNLHLRNTVRKLADPDSRARYMAFSPDNTELFVGTGEGFIKIWDWKAGRIKAILKGHDWVVTGLAFCSDGKRLISGSADQTIRIWDLQTAKGTIISGEFDTALAGYSRVTTDFVDSEECKFAIASVCDLFGDGELIVQDLTERNRKRILDTGDVGVIAICLSHDKNKIIAACWDKPIRMIEIDSGKTIMKLKGHKKVVWALAVSKSANKFISGSVAGNIRIWDATDGTHVKSVKAHDGAVFSICCSPTERVFASCGEDGVIKVWQIPPDW